MRDDFKGLGYTEDIEDPTDEHLMPIFFAYGAAGPNPRAEPAHASTQLGFFAYDSYLFH